MEDKKLSRRERQKATYNREILDAALKLFTANGYHSVTMNDIAEKAEFSIGTLYNFFRNKEDLYQSLVLENIKEFAAIQSRTLDKDMPVLEKIGEFVDNAIQYFKEHRPFIRIFLAESRGESFNLRSKLRKDAHQIINEIDEKVTSVMKEGVRKKIFRNLDPVYLTLVLQGTCQAFLFHSMEYPDEHPDGLQADAILDLFTRGALVDAGNLNQPINVE